MHGRRRVQVAAKRDEKPTIVFPRRINSRAVEWAYIVAPSKRAKSVGHGTDRHNLVTQLSELVFSPRFAHGVALGFAALRRKQEVTYLRYFVRVVVYGLHSIRTLTAATVHLLP